MMLPGEWVGTLTICFKERLVTSQFLFVWLKSPVTVKPGQLYLLLIKSAVVWEEKKTRSRLF